MIRSKTKIVATLGPASEDKKTIRDFITSGVDLFRFNTKHNTPLWHRQHINLVQKVADDLGVSVGLILDLQGPEMRLNTKGGKDIVLKTGQSIDIYYSLNNKFAELSIPYKKQTSKLKKGDLILINDAYVELEVQKVWLNHITATATSDVIISDRKSVNLPSVKLDLPSLIDRDLEQLDVAAREDKVDYVALSFVRNKKDVIILREEMKKRNMKAGIIAKIENGIAIENIDEIIENADAIMVARGDLGVEVPIERLAQLQRKLIEKCRLASKPVITATQMLESMIMNPRPSRAEAVDIANAVYLGSDALMLSGETAIGKYPVKVVKTMEKISRYNEAIETSGFLASGNSSKTEIIGGLVANVLAETKDIDKIVVFTQTGYTARVVSSLRPQQPIIAATEHQETIDRLTLSFGVLGVKVRFSQGKLRNPDYVIRQLIKKGELEKGDKVIMVHGTDWRRPRATNSISLIDVE